MPLSLVDVAGANFRTDDDSDHLNTEFMGRLGVKVRYLPARLAIARSLAVANPPDPLPQDSDAGKSIKGDTLFGTGASLAAWASLIVERASRDDIDLRNLQDFVAAHWRRGLSLLNDEWIASDEDPARFVRRLVDAADLSQEGSASPKGTPIKDILLEGGIQIPIGEIGVDATTDEPVTWALNGPGGSPHSAIMGGVGSGKTRTAVAVLKGIRELGSVPLIAFDFKGDLGTTADGSPCYRLDHHFSGTTLAPPSAPIPLDVLAIPNRDDMTIAFAAERFRESFARLKGSGVGVKQTDALFEAASRALRSKTKCRISDIRDALIAVYAERGMNEDGAIAAIKDICRFPLFEPTITPSEFFRRSWIISLPPSVPEKSRGIVVNLVLDALERFLNALSEASIDQNGNRALRVLCVIDEAHRILGTKLPGLSALVRQSRSKGGAVMLISQSPDDFSGEDEEFLNEMGLVLAFATNANVGAVRRIFGRNINLAGLGSGECLVKRRGDANARRVKAWTAGNS